MAVSYAIAVVDQDSLILPSDRSKEGSRQYGQVTPYVHDVDRQSVSFQSGTPSMSPHSRLVSQVGNEPS